MSMSETDIPLPTKFFCFSTPRDSIGGGFSFPDLGGDSGVASVSGDGQFEGAAVFKALVQGGFELHPDGVGVVLLGLGLVAAHHLVAGQKKKVRSNTSSRVDVLKKKQPKNTAGPCEPDRRRASSGCSPLRSSSSSLGSCKKLGSSAAASEPERRKKKLAVSS